MAHRILVAVAVVIAAGGCSPGGSRQPVEWALGPTSLTTLTGLTGTGQSVSNLAVSEMSGASDDWDKYVEFLGGYSGYLTYRLPGDVPSSSVADIEVRLNYRGSAPTTQTWTFGLFNWKRKAWTVLGTNESAPEWGDWTSLEWDADGDASGYISPVGTIHLALRANNPRGAVDVDFAGCVISTRHTTSPAGEVSSTAPGPATTLPPPTTGPTSSALPSAGPTTPATVDSTTEPTAASSSTPNPTRTSPGGLPGPVSCPDCWRPALRTSWNWVIGTVPSAPYRDVLMYDIDGFEARAEDVAALHKAGKKVVCYISVGSYEEWRPDAGQFPSAILGRSLDGWAGEKWLDVRDMRRAESALARIMNARLDMCRGKGFDAVEFDNMDGYTNGTGFPLTANDQAHYNISLANAAHVRGMSAVMKNDVDQIATLLPYFDMALNEECNAYDECGEYGLFVRAGKAVFNAEYSSSTSFCAADNAANINGVNFALHLDDSRFQPCR